MEIKVKDTGIGIKKEQMSKLFKSFGYIDDGNNLNEKGIGLGLNISQKIVKALGGRIAVKSVFGEGTEFKFAIKIKQGDNMQQMATTHINLEDDYAGRNDLAFEW